MFKDGQGRDKVTSVMDSTDSAARLASLLDKIDQTKVAVNTVKIAAVKTDVNQKVEGTSSSELPAVIAGEPSAKEDQSTATTPQEHANFSGWYEFLDGKSCKRYYHNYVTGATQWDKPDATDIIKAPPPAPLSRPTDEAPVERAYFNRTAGGFSHSGSESYWAKMGRAEDKAGRQLGVFMDISTLEANREEAKRMKEEAQRRSGTRGNVDWSSYKEQKQNAKKRKAQSWMYED